MHIYVVTNSDADIHELVRYTLSYTPAADPIYPPPAGLYVKVKNTSATPLRAAYLHGPYTLYAACYPSTFDPNAKYDQPDAEGFPQFEPYLKAGGSWDAIITIPQRIRQTPTELVSADPESCQSMTWVIEIASQVVFSSTAAVNFEVLVGRDEKSVQLSTGGVSSTRSPLPAQLQDHWSFRTRGEQVLAKAGVYSKAISLQVDDTASLWNSPSFPSFEENQRDEAEPSSQGLHAAANRTGSAGHQTIKPQKSAAKKKKKKVHFVVLTHGLHSNLGADMLYLKESIDVAAKRACERSKQNRQAPGNHPVFDNSSGPARSVARDTSVRSHFVITYIVMVSDEYYSTGFLMMFRTAMTTVKEKMMTSKLLSEVSSEMPFVLNVVSSILESALRNMFCL